MIRINTNLPKGQLRLFGGLLAVSLTLVGWLVLNKTGSVVAAVLLWCCASGAIGATGLVPGALRPVYIGLSYAMLPLGILVSFLTPGVDLLFFADAHGAHSETVQAGRADT